MRPTACAARSRTGSKGSSAWPQKLTRKPFPRNRLTCSLRSDPSPSMTGRCTTTKICSSYSSSLARCPSFTTSSSASGCRSNRRPSAQGLRRRAPWTCTQVVESRSRKVRHWAAIAEVPVLVLRLRVIDKPDRQWHCGDHLRQRTRCCARRMITLGKDLHTLSKRVAWADGGTTRRFASCALLRWGQAPRPRAVIQCDCVVLVPGPWRSALRRASALLP